MPEKQPGFWLSWYLWIKSHPGLDVSASAGVMALLRSRQQGKSWHATALDSCICSFLAYHLRDVLALLGVNPDRAMVCGVVLGYLGTEFIRSLLMRLAAKKAGAEVSGE